VAPLQQEIDLSKARTPSTGSLLDPLLYLDRRASFRRSHTMMQVVDRRSQAGPSSTTTTMTVNSPITSPVKASGFPPSPRIPTMPEGKASAFQKSNLWSGGAEDSAMARTQQFLIETHNNPVRFKLSEAPISAEVPYPPINDANFAAEKTKRVKEVNGPERIASTSASVYTTSDKKEEPSSSSSPTRDLFPHRLSLHAPRDANEKGVGLINKGNTCYMNSTLQAILHLPPLAHALLTYDDDQLYGALGARPQHKFDAIGEMISIADRVLTKRGGGAPAAPMAFLTNLKSYARTLSKFRQEDAHEFLRFLLEAMQACCLLRAPKSMKSSDPTRETTVIHKIFGGKLRSRVQCQRCKHNSDTFDPILDLSLDLRKCSSVTEALEKFTSVDVLTGSEKYRCEKCKRAVDATKWFTVHEAPMVLTIHLKRFTLSGQKINRQIHYPESLILSKSMLSEGQAPQHYKLRSIVHHHGSGPNSGHYVATVKGLANNSNHWYEMNDSSVYPTRGVPINVSDAYILFYVRDPGHALSEVVNHKKRPSDTQEINSNRPKIASLLKKHKNTSSPNMSQQRSSSSTTGISPSSFYASPVARLKSNGFDKSKPLIFRNFNDGDDDDDDLGESIESQSSRAPLAVSSSSNSSNNGSRPKKRKHKNNLSLGVQAGNHKSSKLPHSPFRPGQNNLGNRPSIHSRMKDKHGNQSR
jgi:ubiquitin C-terminal hydrolase